MTCDWIKSLTVVIEISVVSCASVDLSVSTLVDTYVVCDIDVKLLSVVWGIDVDSSWGVGITVVGSLSVVTTGSKVDTYVVISALYVVSSDSVVGLGCIVVGSSSAENNIQFII